MSVRARHSDRHTVNHTDRDTDTGKKMSVRERERDISTDRE